MSTEGGGRGGFDAARYTRSVDAAYRRLENITLTPATPQITLGKVFFDVANIDAQTGISQVNILGKTMMNLLRIGDPRSSPSVMSTIALPDDTTDSLAKMAQQVHKHRNIGDIPYDVLVERNKFIFEKNMDHAFDIIARLTDDGAARFGARIPHERGIVGVEAAPAPREETKEYTERFLGNPDNFTAVEALFTASTRALLSDDAKSARVPYLQSLEDAEIKKKNSEITEEERLELQLEARRNFYDAIAPLIRNSVTSASISGLTDEQIANFVHNATMTYVVVPRGEQPLE